MSFSLSGQLIFDGLAMGLVYVILTSGLVLIISTSRILFLAYGAFYAIGAYVTWYSVYSLKLPYLPSLIIGVAIAATIGMLSYILIFRRLKAGAGGGFLATLIGALGLSMVFNQVGLLIFGTTPRGIRMVFSGSVHPFGLNFTIDKLVLIALGVATTLCLFWIREKTKFGRYMRAVSFDEEAASIQGINKNLILIMTIGLGCATAGFAGAIIAPSYGLYPNMGNDILWTVMLMTMLGGMDSLPGAILGGLILGQILSFGQYYFGSTSQIIAFVIIGIILYFRPQGLLGKGMFFGIQ